MTVVCDSGVAAFLLAGKAPERVALRLLDGDRTYGELDSAATRIANHLVRIGAAKGDRALLLADNSFFWAASYLGILKAGLVCVPQPVAILPKDLEYLRQHTEAEIIFGHTGVINSHLSALHDAHIVSDMPLPEIGARTQRALATLADIPPGGSTGRARDWPRGFSRTDVHLGIDRAASGRDDHSRKHHREH